MKNKELIAILQQLDPEKEVMRSDYDEYTTVDSVKEIDVCCGLDSDDTINIIAII